MIKSDRCLRVTPLPITDVKTHEEAKSKRLSIPLCLKFLVIRRSTIRMRLVKVEMIVEHTESVGQCDEDHKCDTHTSHPISLTVGEAVAEPVQDAKSNKGGDIDRIWEG